MISGKLIEDELVDNSASAGYMHFGSHRRARIKSTNEIEVSAPSRIKDPQAAGMVS